MYRILGSDGREYGPVTADQLRDWIIQGRANAATQTQAEGSVDWKPLGSYSEFSLLFAAAAPVSAPSIISAGPVRKAHPLATTGMILGIVSITVGFCCGCYGLPFNIVGLILSIIALVQIRDQPERYEGKGMAITGLVLSILSLVLMAVLVSLIGWRSTWTE